LMKLGAGVKSTLAMGWILLFAMYQAHDTSKQQLL